MDSLYAAPSGAAFSIVKVQLNSLKPHPKQAQIFSDLSDDELRVLAQDIAANGLRHPIEIMPDGTIIAGHQRVRAVQTLGWTDIDAFVRTDLETEADVVERLIQDNLHRRQLDPLAKVRCYMELKKNAQQQPREKRQQYRYGDIRDHLAKQFGMSGRNLDRLVKILDTPRVVQDAVSGNRLSMKAALAVAGLDEEKQAEIAQLIEAGVDPDAAVATYVSKGTGKHTKARTACRAFVRNLERGLEDLSGRIDNISSVSSKATTVLEKSLTMIQKLLEKAAGAKGPDKNSQASLLKRGPERKPDTLSGVTNRKSSQIYNQFVS